jgi:HEAT repeat protein
MSEACQSTSHGTIVPAARGSALPRARWLAAVAGWHLFLGLGLIAWGLTAERFFVAMYLSGAATLTIGWGLWCRASWGRSLSLWCHAAILLVLGGLSLVYLIATREYRDTSTAWAISRDVRMQGVALFAAWILIAPVSTIVVRRLRRPAARELFWPPARLPVHGSDLLGGAALLAVLGIGLAGPIQRDGVIRLWPNSRLAIRVRSEESMARQRQAEREAIKTERREFAVRTMRTYHAATRAKNWNQLVIAIAAIDPRWMEAVETSELIDWLQDDDPWLRAAGAEILGNRPWPSDDQAHKIVSALEALVGDGTPVVRERATTALSRFTRTTAGTAALAAMARAVSDPAVEVRCAAITGFFSHGLSRRTNSRDNMVDWASETTRVEVDAYITLLADQDVDLRRFASWLFSRDWIPARHAIPALRKALDDKDAIVRQHAALALLSLGKRYPDLVSPLVESLRGGDGRLIHLTLSTLAERMPNEAEALRPELLRLLRIGDTANEFSAIRALRFFKIDDADTIARLREAVRRASEQPVWTQDDWKQQSARSAALTLGTIGPAARPALSDLIALLHAEKGLRICVVEALPQIAPDSAEVVQALTEALDDRSIHVRRSAAHGLAICGPAAAPAEDVLWVAVEEGDFWLRFQAARALCRIDPEDQEARERFEQCQAQVPTEIKSGGEDHDEDRYVLGLFCIGEMGEDGRRHLPLLIEATGHADAAYRQRAVQALGKLGRVAAETVPELTRLLDDPDPTVQVAAEDALHEIQADVDPTPE